MRAGEAVMENRLMNQWIIDNRQLLFILHLNYRTCTAFHSLLPVQALNNNIKKAQNYVLKFTSICCSWSWFSEAKWLKQKKQDNTLEPISISASYKLKTFSLTPTGACEKSLSSQVVADLSCLLIKDQSCQLEEISGKNGEGHTSPLCVHPVQCLLSTTICAW